MATQTKKEEEILCGGCGKNDMRNYYKFPFPEDRCSDCEEEEERTEFEVEYGYMIDEETIGESCSEGYDDEKDAKEYYDMLVSNKEYDYVWLVMRHMEAEDCMDDETIECWNKE